eukprot:TRINITY_DN4457_c0_g1_i1.p3 TRINITY_DN4457_c0_g1~~TRINITY_DN4457_c0_g1_i1.p3  ORF type:complete len:54 (-),score=1.46 TRINITY_DN4457_c0_g1_i1:151-312(-)
MAETGYFWMDIRNYNDCPADPTCTVPSWRDAYPRSAQPCLNAQNQIIKRLVIH